MWPLSVGGGVALVVYRLRKYGLALPRVPAGDLVVPLETALRRLREALAFVRASSAGGAPRDAAIAALRRRARALSRGLEPAEARLGGPRLMGVLLLIFLAVLTSLVLR
jgi:hypothetical protein